MFRFVKRFFLAILFLGLVFAVYYCWQAFPIISGYGAKNMCSNIFICGRTADDVKANELSSFSLSLGTYKVNMTDSSVTGSVFGFAKRTAVYRTGLGATLLNKISRKEFAQQSLNTATPFVVQSDSIAWPIGNRVYDTTIIGLDKKALNKAIDNAFTEPGQEKNRRTRAVVIVYNGKIIAEKYATGFDSNSKFIGWSMTKSITNALVGILVKDGKLTIDAPAPIAEWQSDERKNITLKNLLQMSSGLRWEENYSKPCGATNMLYKEKDMGGFALKAPLQYAPNTRFYYSSGTSNILAHIIRQSVPPADYLSFPFTRLFYKIGMNSAVMEPDAGGTFVASSYSFATARDWARFGLLYLNDGVWNGERILPESWVKFTTTPTTTHPKGMYGAQWWLNAGAPGNAANRAYPDVPTDCYWAEGYEGQNIWVIPSKKLVIVRLALEQGNELDGNTFLSAVVKALEE